MDKLPFDWDHYFDWMASFNDFIANFHVCAYYFMIKAIFERPLISLKKFKSIKAEL